MRLLFLEAANGCYLFLLFLLHVLLCSHPHSPTGVAKAKCTTHSFPPQCCHRRRHHRWPGLCLCRYQTQSLQPHQQKEVRPPPPRQVSMADTGAGHLPSSVDLNPHLSLVPNCVGSSERPRSPVRVL